MSSTAAPWRQPFLNHLSNVSGAPEFVLSTLQPSPSPDSLTPFLPRARFCCFRGMWASLPPNKHNVAPQNARAFESDLLTLTTDVRMSKVPEIFATSKGHGEISQSQGSGGGGPVEAVFWIKEVGMQWRFRGNAFVIARDIEGEEGEESSSGVRTVKSEVGDSMRVVDEEKKEEWSWGRELTAHFGNLSPGMRGTFRNPPPGVNVKRELEDKELATGSKVEDLEDEVARRNFRVVVIRADAVEEVDLTDLEKARRWRYTFLGSDGGSDEDGEVIDGWLKEELWP